MVLVLDGIGLDLKSPELGPLVFLAGTFFFTNPELGPRVFLAGSFFFGVCVLI